MAKWPVIGLLVGGVALLLSGCMQEDGPLGPEPEYQQGEEDLQAVLSCRADVEAGSLECLPLEPALGGGASGVIVGGQDEYVSLEAANVSIDGGTSVFSADVTVRNLLTQTLGSADGETPHADGVRVFFETDPVGVGGNVTHAAAVDGGPDGQATFTRAGQYYYLYDEMIAPGKTSLPRNWKWILDPGVTSFTFEVYVRARVPNEHGVVGEMKIGNIQTIGAGENSSCGLTAAGTVYCWGDYTFGRSGTDSMTTEVVEPNHPVDKGKKFLTISAGRAHNCGIGVDSLAYCWGYGSYGQIGNGQNAQANRKPQVVGDSIKFIAVSAGGNHSCGVAADGTAYCWGFGTNYQLGNGVNTHQNTPQEVDMSDAAPGMKFIAIAVRTLHSCGIGDDGAAYCWGVNSNGQLGSAGGPAKIARKVDTSGFTTAPKFVAITAGYHHTCALAEDGSAYCWGANNAGQLGIGSNTSYNTPHEDRPVTYQGSPLKFRIIAAAGFDSGANTGFTCGITFDGTAYCWGSNEYGQLGNENAGASESSPVPVTAGGKKFIAIDVGRFHACATATDGRAYCWGDNDHRRLGIDGAQTTPTTPVQNSEAVLENFVFQDTRLFQQAEPRYVPAWTTFEAYAYADRLAEARG